MPPRPACLISSASSTPAAVGATASARVPTGSRGASGSTWAPPASASGWRGRWARCRCWPGRWPAVSSHTPRSGVGRAGTAEHVERIVRGWRRVDRIAEAKQSTQRHRSRTLHVYQDEDGMVVIHGRLEPETGAVLMKALEAGREVLSQPETFQ